MTKNEIDSKITDQGSSRKMAFTLGSTIILATKIITEKTKKLIDELKLSKKLAPKV